MQLRQDYARKWMSRPVQGSLWDWWEILNERGFQVALVQPSPYIDAPDWWPPRRASELIAQSVSAEWERRRKLEAGITKPAIGELIVVDLGAPILMVVVGETEESTLLAEAHKDHKYGLQDDQDTVWEVMASSFHKGHYGHTDPQEAWYPAGQWEALSWEGKPPKGSRKYAKKHRPRRRRAVE